MWVKVLSYHDRLSLVMNEWNKGGLVNSIWLHITCAQLKKRKRRKRKKRIIRKIKIQIKEKKKKRKEDKKERKEKEKAGIQRCASLIHILANQGSFLIS